MINIFFNILDQYFLLDNSRIKPLEYTNSFKNYETQKKLNKKCDFTFLKLYKYMKNVTIIIIKKK